MKNLLRIMVAGLVLAFFTVGASADKNKYQHSGECAAETKEQILVDGAKE